MKTVALICLVLTAALFAAAVQTSETESEALSPKVISETDLAETESQALSPKVISETDLAEADQSAVAAKRNVVINILDKKARRSHRVKHSKKNLVKHSKKIHHGGKQIKKLGNQIRQLKGQAANAYKQMIAQIRKIARDSAQAIAALDKKNPELERIRERIRRIARSTRAERSSRQERQGRQEW